MGTITTLDDAVAVKIKQEALAGLSSTDAKSVSLAISREVHPQGHVFNLVDTKMTVREKAALVFVDQSPARIGAIHAATSFTTLPPANCSIKRTRCSHQILPEGPRSAPSMCRSLRRSRPRRQRSVRL